MKHTLLSLALLLTSNLHGDPHLYPLPPLPGEEVCERLPPVVDQSRESVQMLWDLAHAVADGKDQILGTKEVVNHVLALADANPGSINQFFDTFITARQKLGDQSGAIDEVLGKLAAKYANQNPARALVLADELMKGVKSGNPVQALNSAEGLAALAGILPPDVLTKINREIAALRLLVTNPQVGLILAPILNPDLRFQLGNYLLQGKVSGNDEKERAQMRELNRQLVSQISGVVVSMAGIADPTPICDIVGFCLAVRDNDWWAAGIHLVSMLPYLGDSAKIAPLIRDFQKIARTVQMIQQVKAAMTVAQNFRGSPEQLVDAIALKGLPVDPNNTMLKILSQEVPELRPVAKIAAGLCWPFQKASARLKKVSELFAMAPSPR